MISQSGRYQPDEFYATVTRECNVLLTKKERLSAVYLRYLPFGISIINGMIVGLGRAPPNDGVPNDVALAIPASSDDPDFLLGIGMRALQSDDSTKVYGPLVELRRTLTDLINETDVPSERRDAAAHFFAEAHKHITGYPS